MQRVCKWIVLLCVGFVLCCTPMGCSRVSRAIPQNVEKETTLIIPEITLHIRPTKMGLPIKHSVGVAKLERDSYQVYMYGGKIAGKLSLSSIILGHEIRHILQWRYPSLFVNPDTGR